MTSIGDTFKELLEQHPGERFTVSGGSGAVVLEFTHETYAIDSRGIAVELAKEASAATQEEPSEPILEKPSLPFTSEDYPALEKALISVSRVYLDPTVKIQEEYDLWELGENDKNYLPLGGLDFPGHLPYGWSGDDHDYIKFGVDEEGRLYVDVSYIPLGPVEHLPSFEKDLQRILDNTGLGELLSFEEFKEAWLEEDDWILNHFSSTEIYELSFEIVEEKDAASVTPSVGYPLRKLRFPVERDGHYYSIYVHEHQD